jgi:sec-independent protein translocase protein TatA
MNMAGIGSTELILIAVVLVILFGGKKLPELGKGIGQSVKELKKAMKDK